MSDRSPWLNKIRQAQLENMKRVRDVLMQTDGITQVELSERLDMSDPTILQYLRAFRDKGLLDESRFAQSRGGRRPRLIRFDFDAFFSVGVRIQREQYFVVVINMKGLVKGSFIYRERFVNSPEYWNAVNKNCECAYQKLNIPREKVLGIGLAVPCVLRVDIEEIIYSAQIPEISGTGFERIRSCFSLPLQIENEAAAAGLAEVWTQDMSNEIAYLLVEDGIQGSIITTKGIERGNQGLMGIFGHMVIRAEGRQCVCGRKGCLEAYCSTRILKESCGGDLEEFHRRLQNNAPDSRKIFAEYLNNLAVGVNNLHLILDSTVVIGGELVEILGEDMGDFQDILKRQYLRSQMGIDARRMADKNECYHNAGFVRFAGKGKFGSAIGAALQHVKAYIDG